MKQIDNEITIEALNKAAKDFAELGRYIVNLIISFVKQVTKAVPMLLTDNKRTLHHFLGARLRNNDRDIRIFQSYAAPYVYIQEHLSKKYWKVVQKTT